MSPTRVLRSLTLLLAPVALLPGLATAARAEGCSWFGGFHLWCPRPDACVTRSLCFRYRCVCPKPLCDPCNMEHYGYYLTCWHPWPFPPDYRHCTGPGDCLGRPEALSVGTPLPGAPGSEELPQPRR
jgi:hypothetical protein